MGLLLKAPTRKDLVGIVKDLIKEKIKKNIKDKGENKYE
jgi:hypothetical protein